LLELEELVDDHEESESVAGLGGPQLLELLQAFG
jgi:hypothetical protein